MDKNTSSELALFLAHEISEIVDFATQDRVDYPLLTAYALFEALKLHSIPAAVVYGQAAWIEIDAEQKPYWSGHFSDPDHFWTITEAGETIDLTPAVSMRKHRQSTAQPLYSPPLLWSDEIPQFFRYVSHGFVEIDFDAFPPEDLKRWKRILDLIQERARVIQAGVIPIEPIVLRGRKILDNPDKHFSHFDRALAVHGIPPFEFPHTHEHSENCNH